MTWRDFHSLLGAVLVSVMRPLTHAQREEVLAEIDVQIADAVEQHDARSEAFLRELRVTVEQAKRWWTQH